MAGINGQLEYYELYEARCEEASDDTLKSCFGHWSKIHAENLEANRDDLIMWSARHLEIILRAQRHHAIQRRREGR